MKTFIRYLYLRFYCGYWPMENEGKLLIDAVTMFNPKRPEFIKFYGHWLISPPKRGS